MNVEIFAKRNGRLILVRTINTATTPKVEQSKTLAPLVQRYRFVKKPYAPPTNSFKMTWKEFDVYYRFDHSLPSGFEKIVRVRAVKSVLMSLPEERKGSKRNRGRKLPRFSRVSIREHVPLALY